MFTPNLLRPGASPQRILCLGAHSDDIEIGCGGALLELLQRYENIDVHWRVFSASPERAREAKSSAAAFLRQARGAEIVVTDFRDGYFPFQGAEIKDSFEALKRTYSPDLIFTHYHDDRHQDHVLVSNLTWNTFRDHLILEYEIPKYDGDLGRPNFYVPVEEATCKRKAELLMQEFASQRGKHWFDEQTFLALPRLRGMEANSPTRYAEAFYARKLVMR